MIKKTVWLIVLLCSVYANAADKRIAGQVVYTVLERNQSWANINNNYIIDAISPNVGLCLAVTNNNPTNAHPFTVAVSQTADLSVTTFTGSAKWVSLSASGLTSLSPVPVSSTNSVFVRAAGAAHFSIQISGAGALAGTPDTVDIIAVQNGVGCAAGVTAPTWSIVSAPVSAVQATVTRPAVAGVIHVANAFSAALTQNAGTATACVQTMAIFDGACGSTILWAVTMGVPATVGSSTNAEQNGLNLIGTRGNAMCIDFVAACTNVFQSVDLNGIDIQ